MENKRIKKCKGCKMCSGQCSHCYYVEAKPSFHGWYCTLHGQYVEADDSCGSYRDSY